MTPDQIALAFARFQEIADTLDGSSRDELEARRSLTATIAQEVEAGPVSTRNLWKALGGDEEIRYAFEHHLEALRRKNHALDPDEECGFTERWSRAAPGIGFWVGVAVGRMGAQVDAPGLSRE